MLTVVTTGGGGEAVVGGLRRFSLLNYIYIYCSYLTFILSGEEKKRKREFPGGPVVRTLRSHCQGPGFDPWLGSYY